MKRILFIALVTIALVATSASAPLAASGDVQVTVACVDGDQSTEFTTVVDATTLLELRQAIEAITLYPTGLSCTLSELPILSRFGAIALADGAKDFGVMGGQIITAATNPACTGEVITIGISAHVDTGQTTAGVGGTVNQNSQGKLNPACEGHFKLSIHCVFVDGNKAYMTGLVEDATGQYSGFIPGATMLEFWIEDGTPDKVDATLAANLNLCPAQPPATNDLIRGSVLVRDRTP